MKINHLVVIVTILATIIIGIFSNANAQIQMPTPTPTAYLYDGTSLDIGHTSVDLRIVKFTEGTICVVASKRNASDIELQCEFGRSNTMRFK